MIKAREEVQNLSLRLNANRGLRGLRLPYHIDRSQRVGGGHVWPCLKPGPCRDISPFLQESVELTLGHAPFVIGSQPAQVAFP